VAFSWSRFPVPPFRPPRYGQFPTCSKPFVIASRVIESSRQFIQRCPMHSHEFHFDRLRPSPWNIIRLSGIGAGCQSDEALKGNLNTDSMCKASEVTTVSIAHWHIILFGTFRLPSSFKPELSTSLKPFEILISLVHPHVGVLDWHPSTHCRVLLTSESGQLTMVAPLSIISHPTMSASRLPTLPAICTECPPSFHQRS
jgi:hypothetical protein